MSSRPSADELHRVADRLFGAIVDHDLDEVEACFAPDAVIRQNGRVSTVADLRGALAAIRGRLGPHRYDDVRRVVGDGAVVEEHRVRAATPTGDEVDLAACVVLRVDGEGRVTSLDEYVAPG